MGLDQCSKASFKNWRTTDCSINRHLDILRSDLDIRLKSLLSIRQDLTGLGVSLWSHSGALGGGCRSTGSSAPVSGAGPQASPGPRHQPLLEKPNRHFPPCQRRRCIRIYTAVWGKELHTKLSVVLERIACSSARPNLKDLAPNLCNWKKSMPTTWLL